MSYFFQIGNIGIKNVTDFVTDLGRKRVFYGYFRLSGYLLKSAIKYKNSASHIAVTYTISYFYEFFYLLSHFPDSNRGPTHYEGKWSADFQ